MDIQIKKNVFSANEELASELRCAFKDKNIFVVNVLGSPGAGKTSFISYVAKCLQHKKQDVCVIEGDVASDLDTKLLLENGITTVQIETGGVCHLNAAMIKAVLSKMEIKNNSWLFIENIGNLVCPSDFDIGENIKILIASVAEGSDKPYKYPFIFTNSAACILSKQDLTIAIGFDLGFFTRGLQSVAPKIPLLSFNGKTGEGSTAIITWLEAQRNNM